MATSAPSVASASAISLPMPCAAPVTRAILPDKIIRSLQNKYKQILFLAEAESSQKT
jgi:hypothetical protein